MAVKEKPLQENPDKEQADDRVLFDDPPQTDDRPLANDLVLEGTLLKTGDYRVTATGRPVLYLEVEHLSRHLDPEPTLRLEVRLVVMAMGELANINRCLTPGTRLRVTGRLNQKRWIRDGKVRWGRMELVAIDVQKLS